MVAVRPTDPAPAGPAGGLRFRADIDGLRAVAVLLVVAHHVGIAGFEAGFIGVDVFFVISGFLITRIVSAEMADGGRLGLGRFWARRIRRLLPLAATVISSTVVASLLVLNPLHWDDVVDQARAATFFVANIHYENADSGYFAAPTRDSPFLHFWSLAVEEQWYLILPLVLAVVAVISRGKPALDLVRAAVLTLTAVSLLASHAATTAATPGAYYGISSRGWELGVGALVALFWDRIVALREPLRRVLPWVGVATIAVGLAAVPDVAFPAWGAIFPVAGTALLIVGEPAPRSRLGRGLAHPSMQAIGRWSYGWYLWHWPALVLGAALVGTAMGWKLALALGSLGLAALTHRRIEQPVRHARLGVPRSFALGAGLLGLVTAVIWGADLHRDRHFDQPSMAAVAAASDDHVDIEGACIGVDPAHLAARCSTGDLRAGAPILLWGDSHMAHWRPGVEAAAEAIGRPTVRSILGSCLAVDGGQQDGPDCAQRVRGFAPLVEQLRPAAVVTSFSIGYGSSGDTVWEDGFRELATTLRRLDVPLLVVLDTPRHARDPLECLADGGSDEACALTRAEVDEQGEAVDQAILRGLAAADHGVADDATDWICPNEVCDLRHGTTIIPQDSHHVTGAYARSQWYRFADALDEVIDGRADPR